MDLTKFLGILKREKRPVRVFLIAAEEEKMEILKKSLREHIQLVGECSAMENIPPPGVLDEPDAFIIDSGIFRQTQGGEGKQVVSLLTPREKEVFLLQAQGKNDSEIASILSIKLKTAQNYISKIKHKTSSPT